VTDRQTSPHLLKIFSGPHAGAEVILGEGEVLIGSEEACDVILSDRLIEPQHVRLSLKSGKVQLNPAEGATVLLGGKPIPAGGAVLPAFEFFTLGTTHLAVGPADSPWPQTSFPDFQLAAATPAPAAEPAAVSAPESGSTGLSGPSAQSVSSRRRRWPTLVGGAICLSLIAFGLASHYFQFGNSAVTPSADGGSAASINQRLADALREESASDIVRLSERGGRPRVEGYLPTVEKRRALERRLKQIAPTIELRLVDDETLLAGVQRMIARHKLDLAASTGEPGEVIVVGQLPDAKTWELARKNIRDDIRSLRKLTDQVVVEPPKVVVVEPPKKTTAPRAETGEHPAALVAKWEELRSQIAGVQIGHHSSLVLANGDRLFPGTALAAGFVIQGIESDAVMCSNGNQRIRLPLRSHE